MANNILRLKQLPDIVESGSNANGFYIKYRDGTMECWGSQAVSAYPQTITFPQTFAATDYMFTPTWEKSGQAQRTCNANPDARTISGISVWVHNDVSNLDETTGTIRWRAVGKWSSVSTGTGPVVSIGRGIIESGANANGNYVKYEDGTMMQWGSCSVATSSSGSNYFGTTSGTSYFGYVTATFPQPFADATYRITADEVNSVCAQAPAASQKSTTTVRFLAMSGLSGATAGIDWFAIGRWQSATNLAGAYTYGQGVVETGTNSNGTYIKFGDGTLIQYGYYPSTIYNSNTVPLPCAFVAAYQAFCQQLYTAPLVAGVGDRECIYYSSLTTFAVYGLGSVDGTNYNPFSWFAIGRWKS